MTTTEYKTYRVQTLHSWGTRNAKSYAEAAAENREGEHTTVQRYDAYDEPGWAAFRRTDGEVTWVALDHGPASAD